MCDVCLHTFITDLSRKLVSRSATQRNGWPYQIAQNKKLSSPNNIPGKKVCKSQDCKYIFALMSQPRAVTKYRIRINKLRWDESHQSVEWVSVSNSQLWRQLDLFIKWNHKDWAEAWPAPAPDNNNINSLDQFMPTTRSYNFAIYCIGSGYCFANYSSQITRR